MVVTTMASLMASIIAQRIKVSWSSLLFLFLFLFSAYGSVLDQSIDGYTKQVAFSTLCVPPSEVNPSGTIVK